MPTFADLLARSRRDLDDLRGSPSPAVQGAPSPAAPSPSTVGGVSGALAPLLAPYRRAVQGTPTGSQPFGDLNPLEWIIGRAAKSLVDRGTATTSRAADLQGLVSRRGATLTPEAMQALLEAARAYKGIQGTRELGMFGPLSTFRTYAEQARLGGTAQDPGGTNPNATTAGSSYHEKGLAIDLPAQLQTPTFFNLLRRLGWNQLAGEPWHWTYQAYG